MNDSKVDPPTNIPRYLVWYVIFVAIALVLTGVIQYYISDVITDEDLPLTVMQLSVILGLVTSLGILKTIHRYTGGLKQIFFKPMNIGKFNMVMLVMLAWFVGAIIAVNALPEAVSLECVTPADVWYIDGEKQVGYMKDCQ